MPPTDGHTPPFRHFSPFGLGGRVSFLAGLLAALCIVSPRASAAEPTPPPPTTSVHDLEPDEVPDADVDEDLADIRVRRSVERESGWHFIAAFGTDLPIEIGGRFTVETPFRLRAYLGLGGMPAEYQKAGHSIAVGSGAYDRATADLISETLRAAFVLSTGIGFRPTKKGFVVDVGYRLMRFRSRNTPETVIDFIGNVNVPASLRDAVGKEVVLTSALHQVSARMGYEWVLGNRMHIRADVGGTFTLDTKHRLAGARGGDVPADARQYVETGSEWLNDLLVRYAHVPTVGLSFGYQF